TFGFDACLDHRAYENPKALRTALAEVCPDGIDIYFENVAGKVLEAVLPMMNTGGRIPLCGMVAWYNAGALGANQGGAVDQLPKLWRTILVKRLHVHGFIITDLWDQYDTFLREVAPLVATGKIRFIEDIAEGLENAPAAFIRMLEGGNKGKQIVAL
ncbi:MAG: zinc-binding dehydrogenase, partial [Porticoccaceae bacterium]|nr:zinc-binding dehydrogenase [Porticoccaceae bacterium]